MMLHPSIPEPGPLSAYRSTSEPGNHKPVTSPAKPAAIAPVVAQVHVVEFPSGTVPYGTLERAKDAADRYNATRGPDTPEAVPAVAQAVVAKRGLIRPGCTLMAAEVPTALWNAMRERCETAGIDPSRMVAALVLNHLNKPPEKFAAVASQVETWERGKRAIPFAKEFAELEGNP